MSIAGNAGSEAAADEILALARRKIAENQAKPEIIAVLREIEKKAQEIKEASKAGWY
jgi:hypothetical protein